jgi:hypothetical protein
LPVLIVKKGPKKWPVTLRDMTDEKRLPTAGDIMSLEAPAVLAGGVFSYNSTPEIDRFPTYFAKERACRVTF